MHTIGSAALSNDASLVPDAFERRARRPDEKPMDILCGGVRHSGHGLRLCAHVLAYALAPLIALSVTAAFATSPSMETSVMHTDASTSDTLSARQQAIPPITAAAAVGDLSALETALNAGLDAGLSVSDVREILVQLYAYAGFPRSLNALGTLMEVIEARQARGIEDAPGQDPSRAVVTGDALLAAGTANQTRISGAPVSGPLFGFAPVINRFLQTHLFGDIFERDNLDWQSRELATVGALAALPGVESQLRSHMAASLRVGLTAAQLREVVEVLAAHSSADAAARARDALARTLAAQQD